METGDMARQAEPTRAAVLSLGVLAGFAAGIFLYMLTYVLIWGGVAHLLDGLFAATMQAVILTIVLSIVIFPVAFVLLWTLRMTTAALCAAMQTKRVFLCAAGVGALLGVLACVAGLKLPLI